MAIFNSYVSLPEGIIRASAKKKLELIHKLFWLMGVGWGSMENGRPVPAARKHLRFGDDIIVASFLGSESIIPEFSNQFHSIGNQRKTVWTISLVRSTNITWITWRFLLPFFFSPHSKPPSPFRSHDLDRLDHEGPDYSASTGLSGFPSALAPDVGAVLVPWDASCPTMSQFEAFFGCL